MPTLKNNEVDKQRVRICVLVSSYEGVDSPFEQVGYQDPHLYISSINFLLVHLKKDTAKEQIDELRKESFDFYWHFLWGQEEDAVAGVEAIMYMESLDLPIIGPSSKYAGMGKLDFKRAVERMNDPSLNLPKSTLDPAMVGVELEFPVIVKTTLGCGSQYLTRNSVCYTKQQLETQMSIMKEKIEAYNQILIEEFIIGIELAVIVIETTSGSVALPPIQYLLQHPTEFLHFDQKFNEGTRFKYVPSSPLQEKIKDMSCKAFDYLGVCGSGYARVDLRVDSKNEIYLLEINQTPAFFCPIGNELMDDDIIRETYPGGHQALVETIVEAKSRILEMQKIYNSVAPSYNATRFAPSMFPLLLKELVAKYDYSGSVLDVGCGTGQFGNIVLGSNPCAEITGIDASSKMTKFVKDYSKIYVGLVENIIMDLIEKGEGFDHIISSGVLHHLHSIKFEMVLKMMFRLAQKSISMTMESITETYNTRLRLNRHDAMTGFNHVETMWRNIIPINWKIVHEENKFLWESPTTGEKMYGLVVRLERE